MEWLRDLEAQKRDAEARKQKEKQRDSGETGNVGGIGGKGQYANEHVTVNVGSYNWTDQTQVEAEKKRKQEEWRRDIEQQKRESEGKKRLLKEEGNAVKDNIQMSLSPRSVGADSSSGAQSFARGQGLREITGIEGPGGERKDAEKDYRDALKMQVEERKRKKDEEEAKKRAIEAKEEERVG